jgi:Mg-chelatase subunit ChlD
MRRVFLCMAAGMILAVSTGFAAAKPRVEVAFVLDSTGSMGGLIEGAKQKIWSIANSIVAQKPTPEVRIGLIAYRDRGDEYVTREFDLTDDIDAVFKNLQTITADGGGDDPESVNQALHVAVTGLSWTADRKVLKIIFLVGDYPPHMDYPDDVKYPATCRDAAKRGLIIDTVQCGEVSDTTAVWREIARLSAGSYVALAQSGNMTVMTTPFDTEIARTSEEIGTTVVAYGEKDRQEAARGKVAKAAEAPAAVAADRAAFNLATGGKAIQGMGDLVADSADGKVDVGRLRNDELPPEMQKMTPAQRTAYIAQQKERREGLNHRLTELSQKRDAWLVQEQKKIGAAGGGDAFDARVTEIISAQAARTR